ELEPPVRRAHGPAADDAVALEVAWRQRPASILHRCADRAPEVASIEALRPVRGQPVEGLCEIRHAQALAGLEPLVGPVDAPASGLRAEDRVEDPVEEALLLVHDDAFACEPGRRR